MEEDTPFIEMYREGGFKAKEMLFSAKNPIIVSSSGSQSGCGFMRCSLPLYASALRFRQQLLCTS